MKESIESIKDKLKETGFKITPQRRAILEILLENDDKHLSSEEIYDMVRGFLSRNRACNRLQNNTTSK